jgi:hypothetical protein
MILSTKTEALMKAAVQGGACGFVLGILLLFGQALKPPQMAAHAATNLQAGTKLVRPESSLILFGKDGAALWVAPN